MPTKRTYDDGCGMAHALDLVGERWALLVVRELLLGPKRFTDLRDGLPTVSPNVLSQRLRELEDVGVLVRRKLPPPAASWVYELTPWGLELAPVIRDFGRWAVKSPVRPVDLPISVDSLVLSLRAMFDPALAGDFRARIDLRLGEDHFFAAISDGTVETGRGPGAAPDVVVECQPDVLGELIYADASVDDALGSGQLRLTGDRALFDRFVTLFPLPVPA